MNMANTPLRTGAQSVNTQAARHPLVQNPASFDDGSSYRLVMTARDAAHLQLDTEFSERFGGIDFPPTIGKRKRN